MPLLLCSLTNCSPALYSSNGEKIYHTGQNMQGEKLLDKEKSSITIFKSCKSCHGKDGASFKSPNIQWSYLSDPGNLQVAYTESLFFRFLDKDIKSNGTPAAIGVHWKMSDKDKRDLIGYLKTL